MPSVVPIIVGPTGIGKTHLSLLAAEQIPSEIVSADSRQVYKYMDIGTAKVDIQARNKIRHHLIDVCTPDDYFSAGKYAKMARNIIASIMKRNILPIVVGGSGFYISALIDGIFDRQIYDAKIRQDLKIQARNEGLSVLYERLKEYDPDYAAKISENDTQRILRSLEVYLATGQPFSLWHKQHKKPAEFKFRIYGLTMDRDKLYHRIEKRVDKMLDDGLVEEVQNLKTKGYSTKTNALNTVGYKEVFAFLNGETDFDTMVNLIKQNSRRYAKRQMTWFRRDKRIKWMTVTDLMSLEHAADIIINEIS
jgi:tRNA dimethylallyltransferase